MKTPTFKEAKDAWNTHCARYRPTGVSANMLDAYFAQLAPREEPEILHVTARRADCPDPVRWGADQQHCNLCRLTWDTDEERPRCGA